MKERLKRPLFFGEKGAPSNIIVRMPNWLGDLVMATPVLHDLRHHWPDAKITALCQGLGAVLEKDPHVDEVISLKKSKGLLFSSFEKEQRSLLKNNRYDLGVLLTHSFSSAWLFYRIGVSHSIGYATHARSFLLDQPVDFSADKESQHLVTTYKQLLEPLGIPLSSSAPALYLSVEEQLQARQMLEKKGVLSGETVLGINPGAAYGSAKCWLPERFRELALRLMHAYPKLKIVFFGDRSGASLVQKICENLPERVVNLAGQTTLREMMALIQQCSLFLTNDSGPMHVASALNIPLIALFGSTSDTTTGPYRGGIVIHKKVACSPCYRRECPIDFRCMKQITVDEVFNHLENRMHHVF